MSRALYNLANNELHYIRGPALPLAIYTQLRRPHEPVETIGVEWEYPTHIRSRRIRPPERPDVVSDTALYWILRYRWLAYTEDGSGAHEIPLPPCGYTTPSEYLDCIGISTAYIVAMNLPLTDPTYRCGRHHHIRVPRTYTLDFNLLKRAYMYGAIFAAQRVYSDSRNVIAQFREYTYRYSILDSDWDSHYNFVSLSRVAQQLIEVRHPETPPLLSGLYTYLVRYAYDILANDDRDVNVATDVVVIDKNIVRDIPSLYPRPLRDIAETWVEYVMRRTTKDIVKAREIKELFGDIIDAYYGRLMEMYESIDTVTLCCDGGYCVPTDVLPTDYTGNTCRETRTLSLREFVAMNI